MQDRLVHLYTTVLKIDAPWRVNVVDLVPENLELPIPRMGRVIVYLEHAGGKLRCPKCGRSGFWYDTRKSNWQHTNTGAYWTILDVEVPLAECKKHGVNQIRVPWGDECTPYTHAFEADIISDYFSRPTWCQG